MSENLPYWIGFSRVAGVGPVRFKKLLTYFGDVRTAWLADAGTLRALGLEKRAITNLVKVRQSIDLEAEVERLNRLGIQVYTWDDPGYPAPLKQIADPPFVLYVKGQLLPRDEWALAVVGTRSASIYGKEATRHLVSGLAASGVTIVSGLALGIDTQAHHSALEAGGRTLAVLGSGLDQIYPARNRKLAAQIVENGAIISEFPLGTKPESGNFPRRNRLISGLSLGVLMVEGAQQSGARITIDFALEQGREAFAVPGNIFNRGSQGPNKLIQHGAKLVTSIGDILEELNLTMATQQVEAQQIIADDPTEAAVLNYLTPNPTHIDELGQKTGLTAATLSSALTMMELKGKVRQVGNMYYVIARETTHKYIVE